MFAATKGAINAQSSAPPTTQVGGITFFNSGTYSFVVPSGVYQVSAVAIGAGGGGGGSTTQTGGTGGGGGGGGALSYTNNLVVTPGETLTVVVGAGGAGGTGTSSSRTGGSPGGDTYLRRSSTDLLLAQGGRGGTVSSSTAAGGSATAGIGDTKSSGGAGGGTATGVASPGGAGGAAGYSGDGGAGYNVAPNPDTPATSGSGGGGGGSHTTSGSATESGGTLFYGQGADGAAGTSGSTFGKMGSSLGGATSFDDGDTQGPGSAGGGALGATGSGASTGRAGTEGALRVLWGNDPIFPSSSVSENTMSLFASSTSDAASITIPSGVTTGDTVVLIDQAISGTTTPTLVTPAGFTALSSQSGGSFGRIGVSYKVIVDPADAGTSITGMNSTTNKKIILVFRGSRGYSVNRSVRVGGTTLTTSTPAAVTAESGSIFSDGYADGVPIIIGVFYGSSGISTSTDITFSGASFVEGPDNTFWAGYKIYSQTTTSFSDTISMLDRGTNSLYVARFFGY